MMRATTSINGLCNVGALRVEAISLGCLDDGPDCRYLQCVADAARVLQLCNLVLVELFASGQGCFVAQ
jgi:hypothetical protein